MDVRGRRVYRDALQADEFRFQRLQRAVSELYERGVLPVHRQVRAVQAQGLDGQDKIRRRLQKARRRGKGILRENRRHIGARQVPRARKGREKLRGDRQVPRRENRRQVVADNAGGQPLLFVRHNVRRQPRHDAAHRPRILLRGRVGQPVPQKERIRAALL